MLIFSILLQGLAVGIPSEDYFRQSLIEVKNLGLQWADIAKKVKSVHVVHLSGYVLDI